MPDPPPAIDLNCDLAEREPPDHTAALMAEITSANIACAGHAGSEAAMHHALTIGHALGVRLGAHPGLPGNFGRTPADTLTASELVDLLDCQVGRFLDLAAATDTRLHHIKLHGALYHATESSPTLRHAFIHWVHTHAPAAIIYALAGGTTVTDARAAGLTAWDEAFADRAYLANGSLAPRTHPLALITHPSHIAERVRHLAQAHPIPTLNGLPLTLHPQTICLHGDSPHALASLQAARHSLSRKRD